MKVLIVDDQRSARRALSSILGEIGLVDLEIEEATNLDEALRAIELRVPDCALVDIRLSSDSRNRDGLTIIRELRSRTDAVAIVVTVFNEIEEIRAAMRCGASDYILKDELCLELVAPVLLTVQKQRRLEHEVVGFRSGAAGEARLESIVGSSASMQALRTMVRRVVLSDRPVLVLGPTGSGKEVVVRAVHALGQHSDEPLLDLNCGAIPDSLMESQLFGHQKGAFTGAERNSDGYLGVVKRGTLFLDEIAELSLPLQAKLLRSIETGLFRPIGSNEQKQFQGRVVAATHADLESRVREGRFRQDLLFRLNVLEIRIPPLDDHREDIPELIAHFLRNQQRRMQFTEAAIDVLKSMSWPGNVRQLRNMLDRLVVFSESDQITPDELDRVGATKLRTTEEQPLEALARVVLTLPLPNKLESMERALVDAALFATGGNKSAAARILGVHRKVVERRVNGVAEETAGDSDPSE
jgi:DNA-binding NtrC family response regulator